MKPMTLEEFEGSEELSDKLKRQEWERIREALRQREALLAACKRACVSASIIKGTEVGRRICVILVQAIAATEGESK